MGNGRSSTFLSTASSVIIKGLDIEDSQQHLLAMVSLKSLTELKAISIQKKRTALLQHIQNSVASSSALAAA
ncbi:hypothetical protein PM082_022131 [Marasmius tenuissimus]|nr:hypothetical protein PM082_022131 [Marasmius tenuissimus]